MVTYQDCKNCERKQEMEKTGYMCIGCCKLNNTRVIMEKEFEVTLKVKVNVVLDDSEATEQTVRFLVEEDLRDKGWDADVEVQ